jgi:hypothetical protein
MTMGDRIKPGAVKARGTATEKSDTAPGSAADRPLRRIRQLTTGPEVADTDTDSGVNA